MESYSEKELQLIDKAREYTKKKHGKQTRKFSSQPYFIHPENVAKKLITLKQPAEMVAAAYLHDLLEDTEVTFSNLFDEFGPVISELVLELTSNKREYESIGKAEYLKIKMEEMSAEALTIKLCDRLDNVSDLENASEEFRKKYAKETDYIFKNINRHFLPLQNDLIGQIKGKIEEFL